MQQFEFSIAAVEAVVGFLLSIALEKIPAVNTWWADRKNKALMLFGFFEVVTLGWWVLACWAGIGLPPTPFDCGLTGLAPALITGALGFAGSQTGYATTARYTRNARERE